MKRSIYLKMRSLEEAKAIFFQKFDFTNFLRPETISTERSLGRVTAGPIFSKVSSPHFHAAAMDGFAVKAEETFGAKEGMAKVLKIGNQAFPVNTGQPLPEDANAVIMVEDVFERGKAIEIRKAVYPWQNVRKVGEDMVATELILPQNHKITAYDISALLEGGIFSVIVKERPNVTIIPTGDELVPIERASSLNVGQVTESNSWMLKALLENAGAACEKWPIIPDRYEVIYKTIKEAVETDAHLVIVLAGSSAGSRDYTASALEALGELLIHGIAIMPGKPTILAKVNNKPVIGNPGYPVSAAISFEQIILPLLCYMQGIFYEKRKRARALLSRPLPSKLGIEEFLRVKLGKVGGNMVATPLPRAAGAITTLTKAQGITRIPPNKEGISEDEVVEVELLVPEEEIANSLVIIGSHDLTIDLLATEIRNINPFLSISSSNVGSLGGLLALRKGKAHLATSHLFDPETGTYNLTYINKYLKELPVKVINLVIRHQGLIIPKGNPKRIKGLKDLKRPDIVFVNRQKGAGTRVLLDYKLNLLGIEPMQIKGYEHEEFSHMAVAVDVLSGRADVGLGIYAAANALSLDFIPIAKEEYDLVIPEVFFQDEKIKVLLKLINSDAFKKKVLKIGGYETYKTGMIKK